MEKFAPAFWRTGGHTSNKAAQAAAMHTKDNKTRRINMRKNTESMMKKAGASAERAMETIDRVLNSH